MQPLKRALAVGTGGFLTLFLPVVDFLDDALL